MRGVGKHQWTDTPIFHHIYPKLYPCSLYSPVRADFRDSDTYRSLKDRVTAAEMAALRNPEKRIAETPGHVRQKVAQQDRGQATTYS